MRVLCLRDFRPRTLRPPCSSGTPAIRNLLVGLVLAVAFVPLRALAVPLHPGDKVTISVYNHPELLTAGTLDPSGAISIPLAGTVKLAGLEPASADRAIAAALRKYIRYAAADVTVTQPVSTIFVAGGPGGTAPYTPGETLGTAISGLSISSSIDLRRVELDRNGAAIGTYDAKDVGGNGPTLEAGDTIVLRNKPIEVAVRGDVKQPGATYLYRDERLVDAIQQTGGLNDDAARGAIELRRGNASETVALSSAQLAAAPQSGDVLVVSPARHVQVGGTVAKPGDVALISGDSLIAAIYDAGGPLDNSDISHVQVQHGGVRSTYDITAVEHGDLSQNPKVSDGDVVFVPKGHRIDFRDVFSGLSVLRYFIVP